MDRFESRHHNPHQWKDQVAAEQQKRESKRRKGLIDPSESWFGDPGLTLYTQHQVAKMLHQTVQTLRNWRRTGDGPPFIILNRNNIRYRKQELEEWLFLQVSKTVHEANKKIKKRERLRKEQVAYDAEPPAPDGSNKPKDIE